MKRELMWLIAGIISVEAGNEILQPNSTNHPTEVFARRNGVATTLASAGSAGHPKVATETPDLPPLPNGVSDLKFSEFFRPVGSRGLEYSEKLRSLDGRKVRILGYMVKQSQPVPSTILLTPMPQTLHEEEYGFCEDLPPTVVHVRLPASPAPTTPFTPGPLLLTGTLSIGPQSEPDGRNSTVRLTLDPPAAGDSQQGSLRADSSSSMISTNTAPNAKPGP